MTLLVALALATAVKLRPVLASRVTSGQTRLTVLIGTTTLRGSMESDAFAEPRSGTIKSPMSKVRNRHVARLCWDYRQNRLLVRRSGLAVPGVTVSIDAFVLPVIDLLTELSNRG